MAIITTMTAAIPLKIAPKTKKGSNMVVCHPDLQVTEKTKETFVWTK
jgi:hypothetical protein